MKLMIASDLHGSAYYTHQLLDAWDREGAPRLFLLGDILYHGHRTDMEFSADYRFEEGDTVSVVGKVEKIGRFERAIQE